MDLESKQVLTSSSAPSKIMNIIIREPKKEEYNQIVEIVNSELDLYKKVFTQEELDKIGIGYFNVNDLREVENDRNFLVAVEDNKIMGFASWYIKSNMVAWVSMLEVDAQSYGKGIGTLLINHIEKFAKDKHVKAVALETQKKAEWAVSFYKKRNYKILSTEDLDNIPYRGTLTKPPLDNTYIFGKIL